MAVHATEVYICKMELGIYSCDLIPPDHQDPIEINAETEEYIESWADELQESHFLLPED